MTIAGLVLMTLLAGYLVGQERRYILGGIFVIVPLIIVTLRAFESIVLVVPYVALLVPFSLPTGSGTRLSAVMLLVMLLTGIWTLYMIIARKVILHRSLLNRPLLSFTAICIIATFWSIAFRDPLLISYGKFTLVQLGALTAMILSPCAALLIANFVGSPRQLQWITMPFLWFGVAFTLGRIVGIEISFLNSRGLFTLWFVSLAYATVVAPGHIRGYMRLALAVVLIFHLIAMAIWQVEWLSGWLPSIVAILAITLFRSRISFVLLMLVLLLVGLTFSDFYVKTFLSDKEVEGNSARLTLWALNAELLKDHPLFGTGPAGYALYYVTYHPDEARSTHNNYLDIIAQTGLLGTLCFCWLIIAGIREGRAVLLHAPPGPLQTLGLASAGGLIGALGGMALGDWVLPFAYNQTIEGYRYTVFSWIFLGVLMNIRRQVAPLPEQARRQLDERSRA